MQIPLRFRPGKSSIKSASGRSGFLPLAAILFFVVLLFSPSTPASASGWQDAPIIPSLSAAEKKRLLYDVKLGKKKGMNAWVFAKVGDSNTAARRNLFGLGCRDAAAVPDVLRPTVFRYTIRSLKNQRGIPECQPDNSYSRVSMAAQAGTLSDWSIQTSRQLAAYEGFFWAPPPGCPELRTPLQCEIDEIHPRYALVMTGTNDVGFFLTNGLSPADHVESSLEKIVKQARSMGVVPVLSTIPPIHTVLDPQSQELFDRTVDEVNERIWNLARRMNVPMINLWRALHEPFMINEGMSEDGLHLSIYPGIPAVAEAELGERIFANSVSFVHPALRYGANRRNLILVRTLERLDRLIERSKL